MHSFDLELNAKNEICLGGRIDLANVTSAYTQISELINSVSDVRINLQKMQNADSSSLAMLLECIRCAQRQNKNIAFYDIPKFMLSLGRVYGLDAVLPIDKTLSGHK